MAAILWRVERLRHLHVFLRFTRRHNSSFKQKLNEALEQSSLSQNDVKFVPYCVSSAVFGSSFSRGEVDLNEFLMNEKGQQTETFFGQSDESLVTYEVGFRSVFRRGFKKLHQYVKGNEVEDLLPPLAALMRFMTDKDFHESSLQSMIVNKNLQDEIDISTILSVHLFSQLAFNDEPSYMISNDYNFKHKNCPCDNFCRKPVLYGNTSIGTYALWHGRPDIVIFPNGAGSSSIVVLSGKDQLQTLKKFKDDEVQMVEVKCDSSSLRNQNNVKQVALIAMTFSFYQRVVQRRLQLQGIKKNPKSSQTVSLVPTVAVSSESFDIYMYDTEHDIFLRNVGKPVPLWNFDKNKNPTLNLSSVLYLWMIINHLSFKPAITKDVIQALKGKCGLKEKLSDERIKYIEQNISLPMFRSYNLKEGLVEKARKIELGTEDDQDDSEDM